MTARIGINGFGRMGRLALRAAWGWPDLEFAHINEVKGGPEAAAHLLNFDSVHGRWAPEAIATASGIRIADRELSFTAQSSAAEVPWKDRGVDIVLECSGKLKTAAQLAPYLD